MASSTASGSASRSLIPPQPRLRRGMVPAGKGSLRLFPIFIALVSFLSTVLGQGFEMEAPAYDTSLFRRLESKGQIFSDRRDPPPLPRVVIERRQYNGDLNSSTSTLSPPSTDSATSSTITPTLSMSSSSSPSPTSDATPSSTVIPIALPSPFDSSLGTNFTSQNCPNFFDSFLSNTTFQSCVPVSLLLQNSKSFFSAAGSPTLLAETLSVACAVSLPICQPLMAYLASELISDSHCGADYQDRNPLVVQAYAGFIAYQPVFQATCLKSNETGNYCFADAMTNQLNPSDPFPYYAAVGLSLPTASHPTCSKCLQDTMSIFASYAEDADQPLALTYISTAQQIDVDCGAKFANTAVAVGTISNSGSSRAAGKDHTVNLGAAVLAIAVALSIS